MNSGRAYLICLLRGNALYEDFGIQEVPHWTARVNVYQELLQGETPPVDLVMPALECDANQLVEPPGPVDSPTLVDHCAEDTDGDTESSEAEDGPDKHRSEPHSPDSVPEGPREHATLRCVRNADLEIRTLILRCLTRALNAVSGHTIPTQLQTPCF